MHLIPLDHSVQLRPSFAHVDNDGDAAGGAGRGESSAAAAAGSDDEEMEEESGPVRAAAPVFRPAQTEEEIEACRMAFEKFDADSDGTLDNTEMRELLKTFRKNEAGLPKLLRLTDVVVVRAVRLVARWCGWCGRCCLPRGASVQGYGVAGRESLGASGLVCRGTALQVAVRGTVVGVSARTGHAPLPA